MFKWRSIADHFRQMNGYIAFGFILFLAGVVIGGTNPVFRNFLIGQIEGLGALSNMVEQSQYPTLTMMLVIFLNNAVKSIFVMYLGALFGILPLLFLVVNGMVIGFLLKHLAEQQGGAFVFELIFKGLLPHGIIEIPAIVVACAYGLRFGTLVIKALGAFLFARAKAPAIGKELEFFVVKTLPVMVLLAVSLLVASVIESTITTWLMSM
ncbi:stage II sporulation protein M [Paenibacillus sp. N4]|uniref:stage II sporulation protein M n=1 Tax=Paenibacillus vietnamensis TaxID=2590547 RepID=UPI001CD11360|nr:stage II sporulation protein M [Paenibacillus vietnamensis]MCA0758449.1 stage II sporulation protein M [Paenibacillus vietnamensis]